MGGSDRLMPELFALLTALCWAMGSFFGKRGLKLAEMSPQVGLIVRIGVSLIVVTAIAAPKLSQFGHALSSLEGKKGLLYLLVFEGVIAGSFGMIFYYRAIKTGQLSRVMPIAFTTPVWGFLLAVAFAGEQVTVMKSTGAGLAILGIMILTLA